MNSAEKDLEKRLGEQPANWAVRFELAQCLDQQNEALLAAETIAAAPVPPETEDDLIRAMQYCQAADPGIALSVTGAFLEAHPDSAVARSAQARLLCHQGQSEAAAESYLQALALDPRQQDEELEEWFSQEGISLGGNGASDSGHPDVEVPEGMIETEEEVEAIASGKISSLRERRHQPELKDARPAPPPPTLHASRVEEASLVHAEGHYMVDELHPAGARAVAPPPALHQIHGETDHSHRGAVGRSGLEADGSFNLADIRRLQTGSKNTREKVSALTVAVIVHVAVFFVLGLIVIAVPRQLPPQIVAVAGPTDEVVLEVEKKEVQKVTKPNPSNASRVDVVSVANASNIAVPVVVDPVDTLEPIGMGNDFGMAMSFSAQGAGNVSFFGSSAKASKVVFVVDSSASMKSTGQTGLTKHQLMKQELTKTVKGLSSGVQFQIIFFTGPSWFVGENPKDDRKNWVQSPKGNYWRYKDDKDESIRVGDYRNATPSGIRRTVKEIEETPIVGGTDWRVPLKMAIKMEPDVIYFMTDGAVGKDPDKPPVVEDVLAFNKEHSNAKINCICLMVPKAMDDMMAMSDGTRGETTLVLEDGTPIRGRDLEEHMKTKKK